MPYQLEEKIELSFDTTFSQAHTTCDQKYCIDKKGEICISEEFKKYLKENNRVDQYLIDLYSKVPEFQKNDLQWLLDKDPEIREFLTASKGYRLRFKEHDKIACDFVDKIFQFYRKMACGKLMYDGKRFIDSFPNNQDLASNLYDQLFVNNVIWGSNLKNNKMPSYERSFLYLCESARRGSVSDIYRLYDLSSKYDANNQIKPSNFLALLYSLGHGDAQRQMPESISEFVSYFEFFTQFSEDYHKTSQLIAKRNCPNNYRNRALLDSYVFLASDEGFKKAKEVWSIYYENCQRLFKDGINFDEHISDEEFIRSLKSHLACTRSSFPIKFTSFHSAAYHSFKHKDLCKVPAEELQVCSYLELIREVVLNGSALPTRPDQFGKGRLFTFEQKRPFGDKLKDVRVFILKGHQKSTFLLSCH